MSPATQYERLMALRSDSSFDVITCEAAINSQFEANPLIKIETESENTFFVRRRFIDDQERLIAYCVFADETSALTREGSIGHCKLCRPVNGIVTIVDAQVNEDYRKKRHRHCSLRLYRERHGARRCAALACRARKNDGHRIPGVVAPVTGSRVLLPASQTPRP